MWEHTWETPCTVPVSYTHLREVGWRDDINKWVYEINIDTTNSIGLIYYYFRVNYYGNVIYGNNIESLGGVGQVYYLSLIHIYTMVGGIIW